MRWSLSTSAHTHISSSTPLMSKTMSADTLPFLSSFRQHFFSPMYLKFWSGSYSQNHFYYDSINNFSPTPSLSISQPFCFPCEFLCLFLLHFLFLLPYIINIVSFVIHCKYYLEKIRGLKALTLDILDQSIQCRNR